MDGLKLLEMTKKLFNTDSPTVQQIDYVLTMQSPILYLEKNHSVKGHGITFNIPNRDEVNKASHRPWQKEIIEDTVNPEVKESTVMKSRQLGLNLVPLLGN